jgi:hypothetical protein
VVHLCLAQWPRSNWQPAWRRALEDQVKIPDKLADQIYESYHCSNWMCIAWCILVLFKSRALLWYVHESCWKMKFWTSSSPCDRHLILLWDKPAQTHQLAGIYAVEWDHYQHCLPLHISCFNGEKKKKKHGPVQNANTFGKKWVLLNRSDFRFWFILFIFRAIRCSFKMSKYFVHWQVSKPYEDLAIVVGYCFWNLLITYIHVRAFTRVKIGNMSLG